MEIKFRNDAFGSFLQEDDHIRTAKAKGELSSSVVSAAKGKSYSNIALIEYLSEELGDKTYPNPNKDKNAKKDVSIRTLLNHASNDEDDYQEASQKILNPILEKLVKDAERDGSEGADEGAEQEEETESELEAEEASSEGDASTQEEEEPEPEIDFEELFTDAVNSITKEEKDAIVAQNPASAVAQAVQTAPSNLTHEDVMPEASSDGGETETDIEKAVALLNKGGLHPNRSISPRELKAKARLIVSLLVDGDMDKAFEEAAKLGIEGKQGTMVDLMDAIDERFEKRLDSLEESGGGEKYKKLLKDYEDIQDKMERLHGYISESKDEQAHGKTEPGAPFAGVGAPSAGVGAPTTPQKGVEPQKVQEPELNAIQSKFNESFDSSLNARLSSIDNDIIEIMSANGGKVYGDYAYREKLTLEMNTRIPSTDYNLDKIQIPRVDGTFMSLLDILKQDTSVDLDNDMTPGEMYEVISAALNQKKDLVGKDAASHALLGILRNPKFSALNDTLDEMPFMEEFDLDSMISILKDKLELPANKRKEALSKLPTLNNKPFNAEETEYWDELMSDLDDDGTLEGKSLGEKRLFMKEYFNQLSTAQKMLQNSKSPEAFNNLLNVMEAELDGGEARYAKLSEGDFSSLEVKQIDPLTGEKVTTKVFLNPHIYTKENIAKQKEELKGSLEKVLEQRDLAEKELDDLKEEAKNAEKELEALKKARKEKQDMEEAFPFGVGPLHEQFKKRRGFTDGEVKEALKKQQESLEESAKLLEENISNLKKGEQTPELEEMTASLAKLNKEKDELESLAKHKDIFKYLDKRVQALAKAKEEEETAFNLKIEKEEASLNLKKKGIEDKIELSHKLEKQIADEQKNLGDIEKGMETVYKEREKLETAKKEFNKGANPFKIDGQRATYEQALEAKHLPALVLAVKSIEGKQYAGGKTLTQALRDCEKDQKTCDKTAMADKKLLMDYHHAVLNKKQELSAKRDSGEALTEEEKKTLSSIEDGYNDDNLTAQQLATKKVLDHLKTKQYNPQHITRNIPLPSSHEADKGDAIEAFAKTYNSIGDAELKSAEKEVTAQLGVLYDKAKKPGVTLTEKEELELERLEQSVDALTLVAQSRGLPLPQGRTPVDPQLMAFLEEDSDIPPQRRKEALKIIGNLSRGALVNVIDEKTGKNITNVNAKARQIASDGYSQLLDLLDNQAFGEMMGRVDKNRTTSLTELSKMIEDDFCASGDTRSGTCEPLTDRQKAEVRNRMKLEYMTAIDATPDFFAPPASGDSYMRDAKAYLNKREKGNTYFDTDVSDYFKTDSKKGRGRGGYDDDEDTDAGVPWATRLDANLFEDMRRTQKAMGKAPATVAGQKWSTPQVEKSLDDADKVLKAVAKSGTVTPEQQKTLNEAKEFLADVFTKEMGKAKIDHADKKRIQRLTEEIKKELNTENPNYRTIETKWEEKKKILKKNGLDVSKMKTPPGGAKAQYGFGSDDDDDDSGDIYGGFGGRRASSDNSFIHKSLSYSNGRFNTMRKHAYVDYQGRAQLFKPGMSVYHAINGDPSLSGIVRAVYPAIGMVDVQFPMGDQRLPVEDLMIARDIPLDPLLDKASIPGGVGTHPVSAGAVRVASLYMRMKGRR